MIFETPAALLLLPLALIAGWSGWRLGGGLLTASRARVLAGAWGGAVLAAVLAAAGPELGKDEGPAVVGVVLTDVSASRSGANDVHVPTDRRVVSHLRFAQQPRPGDAQAAPFAGETNIEAALRAADTILADEPTRAQRRIWLVSDGAETVGDARDVAAVLMEHGIRVDVQPDTTRADVACIAVRAAPAVRVGGALSLTARISSHARGAAHLELWRDEGAEPLTSEPVTLAPGEQDVTVQWKPDAPGVANLVVQLVVEDDGINARTENDRCDWTVQVLPAPRTLLVSTSPGPTASALRAAGVDTRRVGPDALASALPGAELVVLDGVPAEALGLDAIEPLAKWVRAGGRLVALAGKGGLATGSSPEAQALRRTLPLASIEEEKVEPPPLALVFILDRSDSMARERKWEVAARTTATAHHELHPESQVGLLTFSDFPKWVVRPTPVRALDDFEERIRAIQLSGGTDMFPALAEAYAALGPLDARLKHVVLLSDGVSLSKLERNRALLRRFERARITVSTVAMGSEADTATMAEIARATGGRYWYVEDPDELPRIFAEETRATKREPHVAEPLSAHRAKRLPALARLNPEGTTWAPTTRARTRATAEVLWRVDVPDALTEGVPHRPLLARARFGRGRAVALAAGAGASQLPRGSLARGLVAAALAPGGDPDAVDVLSTVAGARARVEVQRLEAGTLPAGLVLEIVGGDRAPLSPIAVDRAVVEVDAPSRPALGRVLAPDGSVMAFASVPAAGRAEILPAPAGTRLLETLAARTSGTVLAPGSVPDWLADTDEAPAPLRIPMGLLALLLSTLSVLARRPRPAPGL